MTYFTTGFKELFDFVLGYHLMEVFRDFPALGSEITTSKPQRFDMLWLGLNLYKSSILATLFSNL